MSKVTTGALVVGRKLYDTMNAWGGKHPMGVPVPVILGGGTPFFSSLGDAPFVLDGPLSAVAGNRVTHLRYSVPR